MSGQHLAHFNWAEMRAPAGDPVVEEFVNALGRVNALAERSAGFVWRHGDEATDAQSIGWPLFSQAPLMIASFSVWESVPAFEAFVYKTVHGSFVRRGAEWFAKGGSVNYALWWVDAGQIPTMQDARDKVELLLRAGPGAEVFTLTSLPST